ncbi:MAG: hypothetical protein CVV41_20105 [Candidatus Riflebacteria bacterium HGW-Riflebacteria-1]|nr:MAG: hypothetical protein CVV41_20105 [Candidatus Riflebacteria bacterium HGW-Riflebacteria-1]
MKNILVTGGTGFIGKHFVQMLRNSEPHRSSRIIIITDTEVEGYECIRHENYSFPAGMLAKNGLDRIDTVYHLGAFIPKDGSEVNDIERSISNIRSTQNLLKICTSKLNKFIFASTVDVYGHTSEVINEDSLTKPHSLYGHSKLFCEKMLEEWSVKNMVLLQVLRLGHIYGPGEDIYQKLIPTTIRKILNAEPVVIWSSGNEKRSFLYITDACRMIIKASNLNEYVKPVNIASSISMSVKEIVKIIVDLSGLDVKTNIENNAGAVSNDSIFDVSKMNSLLGNEEVELKKGLKLEYDYCKRGGEYGKKP